MEENDNMFKGRKKKWSITEKRKIQPKMNK